MNEFDIASNVDINSVDIISSNEIKEIKELYKAVFWGPPWNEWYKCESCKTIYAITFKGSCNCWDSKLSPVYPDNKLEDDFKRCSSKLNFKAFKAFIVIERLREEVKEYVAEILGKDNWVWFIWWWNTSLWNLNDYKLCLNEIQLKSLTEKILEKYSDFDMSNFYYFAELWVKSGFRRKGIAWKMYRKNLKELQDGWRKYILVRTTRKSDVPYKWLKKMWYEDIYFYEDEQDRAILVYKI